VPPTRQHVPLFQHEPLLGVGFPTKALRHLAAIRGSVPGAPRLRPVCSFYVAHLVTCLVGRVWGERSGKWRIDVSRRTGEKQRWERFAWS
jgi:hypothetical protein